MAANVRKTKRNDMIYEDYVNLWATGMREELIWPILDAKYHLAETTIYRIVLKITQEKKSVSAAPQQTELNFK